jgi:hypothetical protein
MTMTLHTIITALDGSLAPGDGVDRASHRPMLAQAIRHPIDHALAVRHRVELAEPQRHAPQPLRVERPELELRLPQAREAAALEEPDPIMERGEAGDALAVVEEVRRPGEEPQEAGVVARRVAAGTRSRSPTTARGGGRTPAGGSTRRCATRSRS